jgi:hypothetical protein
MRLCVCVKGGDPEREASMLSAYWRKFPEVFSTCCHRKHCYRCHISGFHDGLTCEAYQASKTELEDVLPCPQCGVQLTKGDGCNSVNCVCGKVSVCELVEGHEYLFQTFFLFSTSLLKKKSQK